MHPHCGKCPQCVDRRLVALAAGYGGREDPEEMYKVNILTDGVDGVDRIFMESYVEALNRVQRLDSAEEFCYEFPELNRIINHLDLSADEIAQSVYNLHRRHAHQVCEALFELNFGPG